MPRTPRNDPNSPIASDQISDSAEISRGLYVMVESPDVQVRKHKALIKKQEKAAEREGEQVLLPAAQIITESATSDDYGQNTSSTPITHGKTLGLNLNRLAQLESEYYSTMYLLKLVYGDYLQSCCRAGEYDILKYLDPNPVHAQAMLPTKLKIARRLSKVLIPENLIKMFEQQIFDMGMPIALLGKLASAKTSFGVREKNHPAGKGTDDIKAKEYIANIHNFVNKIALVHPGMIDNEILDKIVKFQEREAQVISSSSLKHRFPVEDLPLGAYVGRYQGDVSLQKVCDADEYLESLGIKDTSLKGASYMSFLIEDPVEKVKHPDGKRHFGVIPAKKTDRSLVTFIYLPPYENSSEERAKDPNLGSHSFFTVRVETGYEKTETSLLVSSKQEPEYPIFHPGTADNENERIMKLLEAIGRGRINDLSGVRLKSNPS